MNRHLGFILVSVLALTCASLREAPAKGSQESIALLATSAATLADVALPAWISTHSSHMPVPAWVSTSVPGPAAAPQAPAAGKAAAASAPIQLAARSDGKSAPFDTHPPFDAGRIPFSLRFGKIESSLGTLSAFVLPGSTLEISAVGGSGKFSAATAVSVVGHPSSNAPATNGRGQLVRTGVASWKFKAPNQHGDHEIRIRDNTVKNGPTAHLRVFVMHPYDGSEKLGSYPIGQYVVGAKDDDPAYRAPEGFVQVTATNFDTQVSPHFQLGQFLCHHECEYPKYLALRTELLVKLEHLLEILAERGLPARSLHVMSGYRTPAYNSRIGNETSMSRHVYGDAADVFLDRDGDHMQDDLNGDGRSTTEDARLLYELVEGTLDVSLPEGLAGGLAVYGPNSAHGPFLHIDTRGKHARW